MELFQLRGSSANKFCRSCLVHKQNFLENLNATGVLRNKENFNKAIDEANACKLKKDREIVLQNYGIKDSIREDIPLLYTFDPSYFPLDQNLFDVMHDFFEGTTQFIINAVINFILKFNKKLTLAQINDKIINFGYGGMNMKDKPTEIPPEKLKNDVVAGQNALQCWLLARALPFIVNEDLESLDNNEKFKVQRVLSLHLSILMKLMSPTFTEGIF